MPEETLVEVRPVHAFHITVFGNTLSQDMFSKTLSAQDAEWYRYTDYHWIVVDPKSERTSKDWTRVLKPLVEGRGNILIVPIVFAQMEGWMSKSFWDWMRKKEATADEGTPVL